MGNDECRLVNDKKKKKSDSLKNEKLIALESEKTKKARLKLRKKLEKLEKQITQDALKKKVQEIHHWIARHAQHRIVLRDKNISLFDENQNAAGSSIKVKSVLEEIKKISFPCHNNISANIDLRKKIDSPQSDC